MKNNLNKYKDVLYLGFFILILVFLKLNFSSGEGIISADITNKVSSSISSVLSKFGVDNVFGVKTPYSRLETKEVVQEESQVVDVVENVSPAVVSIVYKSEGFDFFSGPFSEESGVGTGFIVDKNGLIITNSHVVESSRGEYSAVLKDGTTYKVDKVHLDSQNDFAILEISARDLPTVDLGDSDILKVGQTTIAIGNALGQFQNTVTVGVLSGLGRSISAYGPLGEGKIYNNVLQTDAAINPGNSGGPLLNISGQVIGVNVATSGGADNISFAIPINELKPVLDSFIVNGRIIKPYLGLSYVMISSEIAKIREFPEGAYISGVVRNSPAENAGIKRGDIITKYNGKDLTTDYTLGEAISEGKVGDTVELIVDRDGTSINLKAELEEMPENF